MLISTHSRKITTNGLKCNDFTISANSCQVGISNVNIDKQFIENNNGTVTVN